MAFAKVLPAWLFLISGLNFCSAGYEPPTKYLIVSNARNGTLGYTKLSRHGPPGPVRMLVERGLVHPQGIAVDQKRQLLFVADSGLRKVVSYGLIFSDDGSLFVDEQTPVAEDVEARWVAVNGLGDVFMTDENKGQVLTVSFQQVLEGNTEPQVAGDGASSDARNAIRAPGGVATDNFHVYWTNKDQGDAIGTVVQALHGPGDSTKGIAPALYTPAVLAKSLPKAYGLCLALDNVFFTGSERSVYVVKIPRRHPQPVAVDARRQEPVPAPAPADWEEPDPVAVASDLSNPRGCVWDGESTIFVADRSADAVFAIPGPASLATKVSATKVLHFEGAFGVAVFSVAWRRVAAFSTVVSVVFLWGVQGLLLDE